MKTSIVITPSETRTGYSGLTDHDVVGETMKLLSNLPDDPTILGRTGKLVWRDREDSEPAQLELVGLHDGRTTLAVYTVKYERT